VVYKYGSGEERGDCRHACALILHGCNPGCKHAHALKSRALQADGAVQRNMADTRSGRFHGDLQSTSRVRTHVDGFQLFQDFKPNFHDQMFFVYMKK